MHSDHDWRLGSKEDKGSNESPSQEIHRQLRSKSWTRANLDDQLDDQFDSGDDNEYDKLSTFLRMAAPRLCTVL